MRMRFLRMLQSEIEAAGTRVRRKRPGMVFEIDGRRFRLWVSYYHDERFWRITCGPGDIDNGGNVYELTMLAGELGPEIGANIIKFLRAPGPFRWPLFAHDSTYPSYAWSKAAKAGIDQVWVEERESRKRRERVLLNRIEGDGAANSYPVEVMEEVFEAALQKVGV